MSWEKEKPQDIDISVVSINKEDKSKRCHTFYNNTNGCEGIKHDGDSNARSNNRNETVSLLDNTINKNFIYVIGIRDFGFEDNGTAFLESGATINITNGLQTEVTKMKADSINLNSNWYLFGCLTVTESGNFKFTSAPEGTFFSFNGKNDLTVWFEMMLAHCPEDHDHIPDPPRIIMSWEKETPKDIDIGVVSINKAAKRSYDLCQTYFDNKDGCKGIRLDGDSNGDTMRTETVTLLNTTVNKDFVYVIGIRDFGFEKNGTAFLESGASISITNGLQTEVKKMIANSIDFNAKWYLFGCLTVTDSGIFKYTSAPEGTFFGFNVNDDLTVWYEMMQAHCPDEAQETKKIREVSSYFYEWCQKEGCEIDGTFTLRQNVTTLKRQNQDTDLCVDLRLTANNRLKYTQFNCEEKKKPLCLRGEPNTIIDPDGRFKNKRKAKKQYRLKLKHFISMQKQKQRRLKTNRKKQNKWKLKQKQRMLKNRRSRVGRQLSRQADDPPVEMCATAGKAGLIKGSNKGQSWGSFTIYREK